MEFSEETITKEKTKIDDTTDKPKVVILHNDDYNTFDHVINCLMKICKMDKSTAEKHTIQVHTKGKSRVAEGNDDKLKKIKLQLQLEGLSATVENE